MLTELTIKNIALIDSLRIDFTRGLNALTGETGTGKSIVVDCVNLCLGHRGGREFVRSGEEKGSVHALFDLSCSPRAVDFLKEAQLESDDDYAEVVRELNSAGRSICRINGFVVPLNTLKEFTSLIVDLHGQQEHQRLMNPANHIGYLDSYAGKELLCQKEKTSNAYKRYLDFKHTLDHLKKEASALSQKYDLLNMQVKEISSAKLKKDEEDELERKSRIYENAEKLNDSIRIAYERVYLGGKNLSAQDSLKKASDALKNVSSIDESYSLLSSHLDDILCQVKDIGFELQSIYEDLSFDPEEAERVQDRLELIKRLKRKYGPEVLDVIEFGKKAKSELSTLENIDALLGEAQKNCDDAFRDLTAESEHLTTLRKQAAGKLESEIKEQLKDLGMQRTEFSISFTKREIRSDGAEDVEFMISPNPGEPLRPLADIASGGEISRFMLALKVILASTDGIETMIFDEIDTGISGRMAQTVGEKMSLLGGEKQVICVTHLAQIAALADTEFLVEKHVEDEHTFSRVRKLDDEGRICELTRLIGGAETDESGAEHAKSMLYSARKCAKELRQEAGLC